MFNRIMFCGLLFILILSSVAMADTTYVSGGTTLASRIPPVLAEGYALSFDGDDEVLIPHHQSITFSADDHFTIELWFMETAQPWANHFIAKRGGCMPETYNNYQLARDGISLLCFNSTGDVVSSGINPPLNEWTHAAVTYDGALLKFYVNGHLEVTTPFSVQGASTAPLKIGAAGEPCPYNMQGYIDEARIWNIARDSAEISAYYNRTVNPNTPGLVGYWKFDEQPEDQNVYDSSPMGNHGTLGSTSSPGSDDPTRAPSTAPILAGDHDAAVDKILAPDSVVYYQSQLHPAALVRNLGLSSDTIPVVFRIGTDYIEDTTIFLASGDTGTAVFPVWYAEEVGSFVTQCSTALPTDFFSANDTATSVVAVVIDSLAPIIFGISPNFGGNTGFVTVTISGDRFQEGAEVKLARSDSVEIVADSLSTAMLDSSAIIATLDLRDAELGLWNVVVTNPDGRLGSFPDGFTTEAGCQNLWVDIIGRKQVLVGRPVEYTIVCGNSGNVNAVGVILWISFPKGVHYEIDFEVTNPLHIEGEDSVDWEQVPIEIETEDSILIPLCISLIRPNSQVKLGINLTVSSAEDFILSAEVSKPLFASPPSQGMVDCFAELTKLAVAELMVFLPMNCIQKIYWWLGSTYSGFFEITFEAYNGKPSIIPLSRYFFGLVSMSVTCAGHVVPYAQIIDAVAEAIIAAPGIINACGPVFSKMGRSELPIEVVTSWDPNDKAGPSGFDTLRHYVPSEETFNYIIFFENVDSATADAESIWIVDTLNANLDWTTLTIGEIYPDTADTNRPNYNPHVEFDSLTGVIRWTLADINLPPDTLPPKGEGWVNFSVLPKQELTSGTQIKNIAGIKFDINPWILAPMDSIPVLNTIDAFPPSSKVASLPLVQGDTSFTVYWSGKDDSLGSGIRDYTIYVSVDSGSYSIWLANTTDTSDTFTGQFDHHYCFYSIARDNVGHVEPRPDSADACTRIQSYICGDCNGDYLVNVTDVVYLINYKFLDPPGPAPTPWAAGDVNCDSTINVTDVVYLINYLFFIPPGPPPCQQKQEPLAKVKTASAEVSISVAKTDEGEATIFIDGEFVVDVAAVQLESEWDKGKLELSKVSQTTRTQKLGLYHNNGKDGELKVCLVDITGKESISAGKGAVLQLNMKSKVDSLDLSSLKINQIILVDRNAKELAVKIVNKIGETNLPKEFSLSQNYPNPFNPQTVIQYALPHDCQVQITIYNILGQKVRTLVNEYQKAGYKRVEWYSKSEQGEEVASGIYFYRIHAGKFEQVKKMVLIK
jgi:hypothetical protein